MCVTVIEVIEAALALSDDDREVVMQQLAASLDRDDNHCDDEVAAAWEEEIYARLDDILTGKVQPVSWDEVMEEAKLIVAETS